MAKEIDMYNAHFGDCFVIRNGGRNLLVDFGIHKDACVSAQKYTDADTLIDRMANDIRNRFGPANNTNKLSVLITHFHYDHTRGLIHMFRLAKNDTRFRSLFEKIYFPDVWGNHLIVASALMEEILLKIQLAHAQLPYNGATLLDLVEYLCVNINSVELLRRGVTFEDDCYMTLWPPELVASDYQETLNELDLPDAFKSAVVALAKKICVFVLQAIEAGDNVGQRRVNDAFTDFRQEYEAIVTAYVIDPVNVVIVEKLNDLNHKCNIVFHDTKDGVENILFTGDAEKKQMKAINSSDDYPLHQKYKYIKVPHHGTQGHFFDFSSLEPEYILIPNGQVYDYTNGEVKASYKIDARYGKLTAAHMCSNSNNCNSCYGSCRTSKNCNGIKKEIVFPMLYKTI